jgi:hypothetical protein
MSQFDDVARSTPPQERKFRRFPLQYPVRLKAHSADFIAEFEATSRNISLCGLLVETASIIPPHTPVSFVVTAEGGDLGRPIRFVGEGKVVRVDVKPTEKRFAIAVECTQTIARIDRLEAIGS